MSGEMKTISDEILKQMYKAELHCHLDGSVRANTVFTLAKEQGVSLPVDDLESLEKLMRVGENCTSLEEYLTAFDITLSVMQEACALTRIMFEVCEDAKNDGVRYLEVRFSPILHMKKGLNLSQVMEAICEGQFLAERKLGIIVRIIVCAMRQISPSISLQLAGIAWRYRNKGVCAFDLAGPEQGFDASAHSEAFAMIHHRCLNVTLHSGEGAGWESVEDSIQSCGVHRIGHGVRLIENERLLNVVRNRGIIIESCPSSNLHTKAIPNLESHPFRKFFDAGIVIVPCCDNWTVSNVTLTSEYSLIQRQWKFNFVDILRMMDHGFSSSFLQIPFRSHLREEALRFNLRLLKKEGFPIEQAISHNQFVQVIGPSPNSLVVQSFMGDFEGPWCADPPVTLEIIKSLPKADLHCTLIGSVSPQILYKGLIERERKALESVLVPFCDGEEDCDKGASFNKHISSEEEFVNFWQNCESDTGKNFSQEALQTPELLRLAVFDVLQHSFDDGVVYVELAVRTGSHTSSGIMDDEEVICTILKAMDDFKAKLSPSPFWCGLVLHISTSLDDPVALSRVADLAIGHFAQKDAVCGVGVYGKQEIIAEEYKYFQSIFRRLNKNYVPVIIQAGAKSELNVLPALHLGGARRISGAFLVHKHPRLMSYLATHAVPMEIGITDTFERCQKNTYGLFGSSIRLFLDSGIPLTVCSFRRKKTMSEEIHNIVDQCGLDIRETLNLIFNGFRYNLQEFEIRKEMYEFAKGKSVKKLEEEGFRCFGRKNWLS